MSKCGLNKSQCPMSLKSPYVPMAYVITNLDAITIGSISNHDFKKGTFHN